MVKKAVEVKRSAMRAFRRLLSVVRPNTLFVSTPHTGMVKSAVRTSALLSSYEAFTLMHLAQNTGGAIAEIGAYEGHSSRLLCEVKGDRPLYIFESFAGLPKPGEHDVSFVEGEYVGNLERIKELTEEYPKTFLLPGVFPKTLDKVPKGVRFGFVHLDIDLYEGTRDSLVALKGVLADGALVLVHDAKSKGVSRAIGEVGGYVRCPLPESHDVLIFVGDRK